jgi:type I pantothenate kinase
MAAAEMGAIDASALARLLGDHKPQGRTLVVGLTGAVAAGKSTLAEALRAELESLSLRADVAASDGFLFPNAILEERGLALRKGFPETYDIEAMAAVLAAARTGPAVFPGYSHTLYDVDPALARTLQGADVLIVEGLGFAPPAGRMSDLLIYLDAEEAHLEAWFVERFMRLWHAAEHDPTSFYARFRGMDAEQAEQFGHGVWARINLPNLREHIVHARETADIVIRKGADHRLTLTRGL